MQQSPGNGNTLCLTFAESVALFAQFGIEAIRQVTNEICTSDMQHLVKLRHPSAALQEKMSSKEVKNEEEERFFDNF